MGKYSIEDLGSSLCSTHYFGDSFQEWCEFYCCFLNQNTNAKWTLHCGPTTAFFHGVAIIGSTEWSFGIELDKKCWYRAKKDGNGEFLVHMDWEKDKAVRDLDEFIEECRGA